MAHNQTLSVGTTTVKVQHVSIQLSDLVVPSDVDWVEVRLELPSYNKRPRARTFKLHASEFRPDDFM